VNANLFTGNLIAAWVGILLGFASGMILGLFFHKDKWLGGYASLPRRMYRLGHISFFGLGAANLAFYFTAPLIAPGNPLLTLAGDAFIVGAITMPICCVIMAHVPKARLIFSVPVVSLLLGGTLTLVSLLTHHLETLTLNSL
jgi:hypothetical protein